MCEWAVSNHALLCSSISGLSVQKIEAKNSMLQRKCQKARLIDGPESQAPIGQTKAIFNPNALEAIRH